MDTPRAALTTRDRAMRAFQEAGGTLRMTEAVRAGVHRGTLRAMVERGELEKVGRGLYQLANAPAPTHPDLMVVAARAPRGVICLTSALAYHDLTTQVPHEVHLAIARNSEPPRINFPPVRVHRFSGAAFTEGVEQHVSGATPVRVYSREKTLADCFKFRRQMGLDTCLDALRRYREGRAFSPDILLRYATICRVERVVRPYIEALL